MADEQKQMGEDCANRAEKLDSWSASFIDDLLRKDPKSLSEKQEPKLTEIWERVT